MEMKKLPELCNITTGKLDANAAVENGIYPYFTCGEIPSRIDEYAFDTDAILLAGNNAQGNFHVSRYNGKFNAYQRTYVLTAKENCNLDYIYYSLKLALIQLKNRSQGSQTKFLTMPILNDISINTSLNQLKIATVLSTLDNKIALNHRINAKLEAMAKRLYDYWFVQFDYPDKNGKPYKTSGGKMVWNEVLKREIPEGWEVKRLGDICNFRNGINYNKNVFGDKNYKIVNVRNITASSFFLNQNEFDEIYLQSKFADNYLIPENSILIARSGTPGATRIIMNVENNVIFCGFIICMENFAPNLKFYFTYFLKKLENTSATKTGGSILQNVSQDTLKRLSVILPSEEIIDAFNEKILPIFNYQLIIQKKIQKLTNLRDRLLLLLMNGQVEVEG